MINISTIGGTRAIRTVDAARAPGAITEIDATAPIDAIEASRAIGAIRNVVA